MPALALAPLVLFAVQWLYFAVLEGLARGHSWQGGLRAARAHHDGPAPRLQGGRTSQRAPGRRRSSADLHRWDFVSLAGLASMSATRRFQRLGDLVAGTIVVVPSRARKSAPIVLSPPADPRELAALPGEVRLDADEREAIEMFLRRRAELGRARELELASMIAPQLCARFGFTASDPSRALALLYDCAANTGRGDGPPSSEGPHSWR